MEEFPFMRRGDSFEKQKASGGIHDLYGAWGVAVGDGWYKILQNLCYNITEAYEKAGLPVDIVIDQIKEKFGRLKFVYHTEGGCPVRGGGSIRVRPEDSEIHREVAWIVGKYELLSETVCEICGHPGLLRRDIRRIKTVCDSCYVLWKQDMDKWKLKRSGKDGQ